MLQNKSEKNISCSFFRSSILRAFATSKSVHPILSLKTLVHMQGMSRWIARHVSLNGMSVNHPIKVQEPNQNAGISRIFCEPDSKDAGITSFECEPHTQKKCSSSMHGQNAGLAAQWSKCWNFLILLWTQRSKVKRSSPSGQWPIAADWPDWWRP